ncbi:MAG: transposase [Anaerolineales bacterium]
MNTQTSTRENINRLIAFRQEVYGRVFTARRDALFDVLDALLSAGSVSSFAMLSQSERFRRKWPSLYAAVEDGRIDAEALRTLLIGQLPRQGLCLFPLDGSSWPRPRSRVLKDLQHVYQASSDVNGGTVTVGYPYSLLEWCAEPHSSWSLPLDVRRIPSQKTAQAVGAEQVHELARLRADCPEALDIVLADGKYGNRGFLQPLQVGVVVRLRSDRVLFRPAPPVSPPRRGRPRKHGARFDFKNPATWDPPDEVVEFEDERYGQVRLERWNGLHERKAPELVYDGVRASVHRERQKPLPAVWFGWLSPPTLPPGIILTASTIWNAYVHRWPIEPSVRFRKESLGWTLPRFQHAETGDTWTLLVALAHCILFLARPIVEDTPLPWQKSQTRLTPQRVRQSLKPIFALIGSPAREPKWRGKPPGWPNGKPRTPKQHHKVVKKGAVTAQPA